MILRKFLFLPCAAMLLMGQTPPDVAARLTAVEAAAKAAQSAGDNAWMLMSAALVLLMTGPGLALFYGGLVRRKNVLGTMMQSFALMALVTVIWAVVGYSLAFGGSGPYLGDLRFAFLRGVGSHHSAGDLHGVPVDVRHHHAGADLGCVRGAHEVQRHDCVHHAVEPAGLFPHGAHGMGQGRAAERL
jgi:hypothetical protein